jgi:hypothetical protein
MKGIGDDKQIEAPVKKPVKETVETSAPKTVEASEPVATEKKFEGKGLA